MPADVRLSDLSPREREVLRLLAAGHTAKSVATALGSTESAINERLRDARRKSGVGSSRELARLLAAQEVWDNFSGLPPVAGRTEAFEPPASPGRHRSKGALLMLLALPSAAAALVLAAAPSQTLETQTAATHAAALPAIEGEWALDTARIPEAERPRAVTIRFRASGDDRLSTDVEIVAPDGTVRRMQSTATLDGTPAPIAGDTGIADTVALRRPAPGALVMTLAKNGTRVSTRMYAVSKDRRTMTETIVWPGSDLPRLETTHFTRKD